MKRFKVVLLVTSLSYGGAQTQVVGLAQRLQSRGWEVLVVSMLEPEALVAELSQAGVRVVSLGMRRGRPGPGGWWRLVRLLRAERPDVLHSHMVHANLLARAAQPLARVQRLICTAHNVIEGGRWRELAYRFSDPMCDLTTNVSRAAAERYVRVGAVPAHRMRYVPNGVDEQLFRPDVARREQARRELGLGQRFVWLAVGRCEAAKDLPTLLRAFAALRRGHEATLRAATLHGATLLIVGDGPERPALERLAGELELGRDVRFLGLRRDIPALMNAADAYAMSSAWEGLPMVLLEALASGLAVVATDVGGNREVVQPEVDGLLVPPGDPAALADAMSELMARSPIDRALLGSRGRALVQRDYALSHVTQLWESLFLPPAPSPHRPTGGQRA